MESHSLEVIDQWDIDASLRDCLAWCNPFRDALPSQVAQPSTAPDWCTTAHNWTQLVQTPGSMAAALRRSELAAAALAWVPDECRDWYKEAYPPPAQDEVPAGSRAAFRHYLQTRHAHVAKLPPHSRATDHAPLRELARERAIMVTDVVHSLHEGAAMVVSGGFFDVSNVPPWDTWLGLLAVASPSATAATWCLVSWVPAWAGDLVDQAIPVSTDKGQSWLAYGDGRLRVRGWALPWSTS